MITPIFGLASMIHATVNRMPGMTSGMMASAKNSVLNGVLVRSFIQASAGADDERQHRGADGELQRVEEQPRVVAAQIGGAEILQRELRRRGGALRREKTLPQQEHERDEGEPDDQRDRNADQQPFRIEPRHGSGQGQAPDRVGHRKDPHGSDCESRGAVGWA